MTGPEHYREAEHLLERADSDVSENMVLRTGEAKADILAAAQVHATLALTAATAAGRLTEASSEAHAETYIDGCEKWHEATR